MIGGQETWVNAIRCLIFDPEEGAPTHVALAKIDPIASTHLVKGQQAMGSSYAGLVLLNSKLNRLFTRIY